jgi:hypothetical protein
VENTIAFRAHIREQVEVVEGLHKEKYAEETKLKKAKKVLEGELQEKRKMQALMSYEEDEKQEKADGGQKSIDNTDKDSKTATPNKPTANGNKLNDDTITQDEYVHFPSLSPHLPSFRSSSSFSYKYFSLKPRRDLLQIQKEEDRLRRMASVEVKEKTNLF